MARTRKQNNDRSEACAEYKAATERCELSRWIGGFKVDGDEVHHIAGRGRRVDYESTCNLILLSKPSHDWVHSHPVEGEICCLYAKWKKHLKTIELWKPITEAIPIEDWLPPLMGSLYPDFDGLLGRLHYLHGKCVIPQYVGFAQELIHELSDGDIAF